MILTIYCNCLNIEIRKNFKLTLKRSSICHPNFERNPEIDDKNVDFCILRNFGQTSFDVRILQMSLTKFCSPKVKLF